MNKKNSRCVPLKETNRETKIIVSLTSFPGRIKKVAEALLPLFRQTLPPDRIILWLAKEQFKRGERSLPGALLKLKKYGLEIAWCDDLKPHKKYYYSIKNNPDDIIITIDDDVIYTETLVEKLYEGYKRFPNAISALRVHKIIFKKDGSVAKYNEWIKEYPAEIFEPRFDLMPTGVGGVLYPPHCFSNIVFDDRAIKDVCLWADDLWLKVDSLINNVPVVLVQGHTVLNYIEGTQTNALWQKNVELNLNDEQMTNILGYLNVNYSLSDIFSKAYAESPYLYADGKPKVSVVMPVYNVETYLREALDSVCNQYLEDIEIICVNDGSTDSSLSILKEYQQKDPRIVIIDKPNSGYGDSMNRGIYSAKGEYIGIVETDDNILPDMYLTLYCIAKEKELDLVKGDILQFMDDGEDRKTKYISVAGKFPSYYEHVIDMQTDYTPLYFTMNTWAGIYRKEYIYAHNIKHNLTPGASYQDSGFWFQSFIWARRVYFLNRAFYLYRQDNPNSSINNPDKVYCVCDEYDFIYKILEKNPKLKNFYTDIFVYRRYYSYMFALSKMGDKYKYDFLKRFSEDFCRHRAAHEINFMLFAQGEYNRLKTIMDNPAKYYADNYYDRKNLYDYDISTLLAISQKELEICKRKLRSYESCVICRQLIKVKNINAKIKVYTKLLDRVYRCYAEHGFLYTAKRIKVKLAELKAKRKNRIKVTERTEKGESASSSEQVQKDKELKVLFIASDNSPSSGAFLSMTNLALQLKTKYNVSPFVILPKGGKGGYLLDEYDIPHKTIISEDWVIPLDAERNGRLRALIRHKKRSNKAAIKAIAKFIEKNYYDIVHLNTTYTYVGAIAAKRAGRPFVWHLREFLEEDQEKTLWDRKKGNKLINTADRVVAISESLYEKYKPVISDKKLKMIHNGINAELFYKPNRIILEDSRPIFIFVGGFAVYKGHVEFVNAIIEVAKRGISNFEVWFIGTGNQDVRQEVEEMLINSGLENNYKIIGYRKDVENYFDKADISFTCARSEAFGRTTVEAMMSGALVIGADAAGTRDLISDNKTGILYKSGDYMDLADKIIFALNNKNEMQKIARAGQKYMYENMTAELNAKKIKELYDEVLNPCE